MDHGHDMTAHFAAQISTAKVFLEGLRSRGRRQLRLRTGLLKALRDIAQRTVALVPLAMSYERSLMMIPSWTWHNVIQTWPCKTVRKEQNRSVKIQGSMPGCAELGCPGEESETPAWLNYTVSFQVCHHILVRIARYLWNCKPFLLLVMYRASDGTVSKESLFREMCGLPRDPLRTSDLFFWVLQGIRGELPPIGEAFMRQGHFGSLWGGHHWWQQRNKQGVQDGIQIKHLFFSNRVFF